MSKKIFVLILAIILTFNIGFRPIEVKANSATLIAETITDAEWLANGSELLAEALQKYGALGATALSHCSVVIGSAVFAVAAMRGIEFAVDKSLETSATLGRYIVDNISTLDGEIQRYVTEVIFNCSVDSTYYNTHSNVYRNGMLNKFDKFLDNYIDYDTIHLNQGMVAQNVIPEGILSEMTTSIFNSYSNMVNPVYVYNHSSITYPYTIYEIPSEVVKVWINNNGVATFYDVQNNFVNSTSYCLRYANPDYWNSETINGWNVFNITSLAVTLTNCVVDWGGLEVLTGDSYADAFPVATDYTLGIDRTNERDVPLTTENDEDLVVPYTHAIDWGTGAKDVTEEDNIVVPTSGFMSSVLGFLKSILDAIISIPQKIADAIGEILISLFVPSEADVQSVKDLLSEKLPIVEQLKEWGAQLGYILEHPEEYLSNLDFSVDMSKAETYWDYGGSKTNMISLDWYFRYKEKVDDIIVGFAWLVFLWNLYGQLPNIISAIGSGVYLDTKNTWIMEHRDNYKKKGD